MVPSGGETVDNSTDDAVRTIHSDGKFAKTVDEQDVSVMVDLCDIDTVIC